MSFLKAKQIMLPEEGSILIGGAGGKGQGLAVGGENQILRITQNALGWSDNDTLSFSSEAGDSAFAIDQSTVEFKDGNGVVGASITSDFAGDYALITSNEGAVTFGADGDSDDVDIVLAPKGEGDVVIAGEGAGRIQSEADEDLYIMGGEGSGNLILGAGGKVFYGDPLVATNEVATLADLAAATSNAERVRFSDNTYTGAAIATLAITSEFLSHSLKVTINGVDVPASSVVIAAEGGAVTFTNLGYTVDADDTVRVSFAYLWDGTA